MSLYERLRKEHYIFTLGKRPSTMQATCEYIEGIVGLRAYQKQKTVAEKYNSTEVSIQNYAREVMLRLGYKPEDYRTGAKMCMTCPYRAFYMEQRGGEQRGCSEEKEALLQGEREESQES